MKYLSQEFLDEALRLSQGFADRPNANARIQYVVSGGPDGDVSYYWVLVGGKLQECKLGELPDADFTLRMSYDTSVRIQKGDLNPNVAFMTGKMKASGSTSHSMLTPRSCWYCEPVSTSAVARGSRRRFLAFWLAA